MAPEANFYNYKRIWIKYDTCAGQYSQDELELSEAYKLYEQLGYALQDADYPPKG